MSTNTAAAVVGNLTRDPELRFTAKGNAVLNFSIAVNESETKTCFYDVVAWKSLAQNAAEVLVKGMRVVVFGVLEQSSWETQTGEKRSKVQIVAEAIGPDLRFATADVRVNKTRPVSPAPQQQYMTDEEWALERQGHSPEELRVREEPF